MGKHPESKICDRCLQLPALAGICYCSKCKRAILKELFDAGYLEPKRYQTRWRGPDMREDTHETKHGVDL